jgi:hypothetical protein
LQNNCQQSHHTLHLIVSKIKYHRSSSSSNILERSRTRSSSYSQRTLSEDIRLCSINRADATDSYGIELNYKIREQLHILKIQSDRNTGPSSKNCVMQATNFFLPE